jgi:preprotein translocase subunit SecB
MQIRLIHTQVIDLHFGLVEGVDDKNEETEMGFNLDFKVLFSKDKEDEFHLVFESEIKKPDVFDLSIKYLAVFKTDEEIDDEFENSHFPYVNAPAITFPFLRSFISTLMINAGYPPVILPSINFTTFKRESRASQQD